MFNDIKMPHTVLRLMTNHTTYKRTQQVDSLILIIGINESRNQNPLIR